MRKKQRLVWIKDNAFSLGPAGFEEPVGPHGYDEGGITVSLLSVTLGLMGLNNNMGEGGLNNNMGGGVPNRDKLEDICAQAEEKILSSEAPSPDRLRARWSEQCPLGMVGLVHEGAYVVCEGEV